MKAEQAATKSAICSKRTSHWEEKYKEHEKRLVTMKVKYKAVDYFQ